MGGQPSTSREAAVNEKATLDRLRTMGVREEEDYVEIEDVDEKGRFRRPKWKAEELPIEAVAALPAHILKDPKNRLAHSALSSGNPRHVITSLSTKIVDQQIYNIQIPFEGGPITNQRQSGRCWLFASTNVFRVALMKKYNLESFELSQTYLYYWDKLEKANWFLEQVIDTAGEDLDSRLVQTLMGDIAADGGQWDMVYNLVDKYGLVPQTLYPDNWNAENTSVLNSVVRNKLREYAMKLRKLARGPDPLPGAAWSSVKVRMMKEIQQILTILLGPPPKPTDAFTWQYNDRDGKAHELTITPKDFARDISSAEFRVTSAVIESMVSLVHDPRNEPLSLLTVSRLGNVIGGRGINYINVDMDTLKSSCIKMLKAGLPVFFGCDVGKFSDDKTGIMDTALFDYELGLGSSLLGMTKAQRLLARESSMTHAMVLTAVHVDEKTGKSVRWRVQNSYGPDVGAKGWYLMSDAWMDEFVYQAVIDPRFCSKEVREVVKKEPIVLPLWDPIGALA